MRSCCVETHTHIQYKIVQTVQKYVIEVNSTLSVGVNVTVSVVSRLGGINYRVLRWIKRLRRWINEYLSGSKSFFLFLWEAYLLTMFWQTLCFKQIVLNHIWSTSPHCYREHSLPSIFVMHKIMLHISINIRPTRRWPCYKNDTMPHMMMLFECVMLLSEEGKLDCLVSTKCWEQESLQSWAALTLDSDWRSAPISSCTSPSGQMFNGKCCGCQGKQLFLELIHMDSKATYTFTN